MATPTRHAHLSLKYRKYKLSKASLPIHEVQNVQTTFRKLAYALTKTKWQIFTSAANIKQLQYHFTKQQSATAIFLINNNLNNRRMRHQLFESTISFESNYPQQQSTEVEFLDIIGTNVLIVILLAMETLYTETSCVRTLKIMP